MLKEGFGVWNFTPLEAWDSARIGILGMLRFRV